MDFVRFENNETPTVKIPEFGHELEIEDDPRRSEINGGENGGVEGGDGKLGGVEATLDEGEGGGGESRGDRGSRMRNRSMEATLSTGQRRRLCLRQKRSVDEELRRIHRHLLLLAFTLFVYILNAALTPSVVSKVRLQVRRNKEVTSWKKAALNMSEHDDGVHGEGGGGGGGVTQSPFTNNFTAMSKELLHLYDLMEKANAKNEVYGQIGHDFMFQLVGVEAELRAISKQQFHVDFCALAQNSTMEMEFPANVTSMLEPRDWPRMINEGLEGKAGYISAVKSFQFDSRYIHRMGIAISRSVTYTCIDNAET